MPIFSFGIPILLVAIAAFYLNRNKKIKDILLIAGATILIYRISTAAAVYYWGNSEWWKTVYNDVWNHYQLGAGILILVFLLKNKLSNRLINLGIGIGGGMMIDEITDLIKLFHVYPLPSHFRDSPGDLYLILTTYGIAVILAGIKDIWRNK
ncbi:MAG TPA: hypothetical protein VF828_03500 [Patescibacteria group bacterium]